jgi:hypothetical protein
MAKHKKLWILIAAGVAIVALFLLSSSLSTVELLPGKPFPWGLFMRDSGAPPGFAPMLDGMILINIVRVALIIMLPITAIYLIFTKEGRKRALRVMLQLMLFMFLMSFVIERQMGLLETAEEMMGGSSPLEEMPFVPAPEFTPGDMSDLTTVLSLGLALVLTAVIAIVLYVMWRRSRLAQDDTLLELAREAQDALDEIQTGGSLKNAVIRCYAEMNRVIGEKRHIERGIAMTSHEFEEHLVKAGLPKAPVQDLTRLFEEVRYGDRDPAPGEEQRAIASLSSIVTAVAELSR